MAEVRVETGRHQILIGAQLEEQAGNFASAGCMCGWIWTGPDAVDSAMAHLARYIHPRITLVNPSAYSAWQR